MQNPLTSLGQELKSTEPGPSRVIHLRTFFSMQCRQSQSNEKLRDVVPHLVEPAPALGVDSASVLRLDSSTSTLRGPKVSGRVNTG